MIRLQKLLAEAGPGPRRTIEEWIRAGRRARAVGLDGRRLDLKPGEAVPGELLLTITLPSAAPGGTAVRSKPRSAPAGPAPPRRGARGPARRRGPQAARRLGSSGA